MAGPDAARYLLAGRGTPVARPFNLRWLAPAICRDDLSRWNVLWRASWPVAAAGAVLWAWATGLPVGRAVACAAFLMALPGVYGPHVSRPVQVDLPSMAVGLVAAALMVMADDPAAVVGAVLLTAVAASFKESAPIWVALWAWSPWPLLALVVPAVVQLVRRPVLDEVTQHPVLLRVHDHPFRSAVEHRAGRSRDAWLWVAPWGATLAALVPPDVRTLAALAVGHLQLLVATDTVRLLATTAGPAMALGAATNLPAEWLVVAVVVHTWWWRQPELI